MSDTSAPAPEPVAPPQSPGGADVETPAAQPPGDAPTDPAELQSLVTRLRDENVKYKERFRPWEQSVGNLHPSDSAFILEFVDALYSGDAERTANAVGKMRAALDQLSPAQQEQVREAIADASPDFDPYDPRNIDERVRTQLEQALEERDKTAAYERAVDQAQARMADHARELAEQYGIPELGDARTKWGRLLYMTAHNDFPDERDPMVKLDLAARDIVEDFTKQGQALLKAKTAEAGPSPVPAEASEPSGQKKPRDLKEADKAAAERLDKILSGQVGT